MRPGTVTSIARAYGEIYHEVFFTVLVPNGRFEFTAGEVSHRMKNCAAVDLAGLGWEGENCGRKLRSARRSRVMSTTVREIRDADEEEAERKERLQEAEGEGEDEDSSEDEDFKPDENDIDEEDGDEGEFEEGMECEIAGKGGKAAPGGKRKRAAAAPKKAASKKPTKAKRGGGIALSDDEADGATGASAAPAEAAPPVDPKQAEEEAKKAAADAKKAAADALWAEMNGSSAPKKPATKPAAAGGLDLKSLIAKASGGGGSNGGGKMVTITETMSFAGKDVSVTKQVLAGLQGGGSRTWRVRVRVQGQG